MNVDCLAVDTRSVTLLRISLCRIAEETGTNSFLNTLNFTTARDDFQLVTIHDSHELLSNILRSLQCSRLNEVVKTPSLREIVMTP
jgi:hypothetical protein